MSNNMTNLLEVCGPNHAAIIDDLQTDETLLDCCRVSESLLRFRTANSPPEPVISQLAKDNPRHKFVLFYADEFDGAHGFFEFTPIVRNGVVNDVFQTASMHGNVRSRTHELFTRLNQLFPPWRERLDKEFETSL